MPTTTFNTFTMPAVPKKYAYLTKPLPSSAQMYPGVHLGVDALKQQLVQHGFSVITTQYPSLLPPPDIKAGDIVLYYLYSHGASAVPNAASNDADGSDEQAYWSFNLQAGATADNTFLSRINSSDWKGAHVFVVCDMNAGDMLDAPANIRWTGTNDASGNPVFASDSLRSSAQTNAFPDNVCVLYGTSVLESATNTKYGSYTYQASWMVAALLSVLSQSTWNITYKQLLVGVHKWYADLALSSLDQRSGYVTTPYANYCYDTQAYPLIKARVPVLGLSATSAMADAPILIAADTPLALPFSTVTQSPVKRAVLVGPTYPLGLSITLDGISCTGGSLMGCHNDTILMYKLLTEQYGFAPDNIKIISNTMMNEQWPSKAMVMEGIDYLMTCTSAQDTLVFYFSGHGNHVADTNGDEADARDEIIAISNEVMTDDEIYNALTMRNTNGAKLVCMFDCCSSGTMGDMPTVVRSDFAAGQTPSYTKTSNAVGSKPAPPSNVFVMSSCLDPEISYSRLFDSSTAAGMPAIPPALASTGWKLNGDGSVFFGYFTYSLYKALENNGWQRSFAQLLMDIRSSYLLDPAGPDSTINMVGKTPLLGLSVDGTETQPFLELPAPVPPAPLMSSPILDVACQRLLPATFSFKSGSFPTKLRNTGDAIVKVGSPAIVNDAVRGFVYSHTQTGSNYLAVPTFAMPASYTKMFWIKWLSPYASTNAHVLSGMSNVKPYHFLWLQGGGTKVSVGHARENATAVYTIKTSTADSSLPTNAWYHFAVSYDNRSQVTKVYRNGARVADTRSLLSATDTFDWNGCTGLCLGAIGNLSGDELANVLLDNVRVFSTPLPQATIQAMYQYELASPLVCHE